MRVKRPTFRTCILAGIILLLALSAWVVIKPGGTNELAAWKMAAVARGEVFDLAKLAPKFSQDCLAHEASFSNAVQRLVTGPLGPGMTDVMGRTNYQSPATVAWRRPFPIERTKFPFSWEEVAVQMATNAPAFAELRELLEHIPPGSARDTTLGVRMSLGPLISKRKAAQMLTAGAVSDLHRGALDEALDKIHTMLLLSRWHEGEFTLVDQMIRVAIVGLTVSTTWEALQAPGWDEAKLAKLQAGLEGASIWPKMERTVVLERAFGLSAYEMARTNAGGVASVLASPTIGGSGFADFFNESVYAPAWQTAWSQKDELLYLKAMQGFCDAWRQAAHARSFQVFKNGIEKGARDAKARQGLLDRWRFPLMDSLQPNWSKAGFALMRGETMREMACAAVAIERNRMRRGALPDNLRVLTPEFLRETPHDFMNGEPLRYHRGEGGHFALWSVGEDGRDGEGKQGSDDLVWPEPADQPR